MTQQKHVCRTCAHRISDSLDLEYQRCRASPKEADPSAAHIKEVQKAEMLGIAPPKFKVDYAYCSISRQFGPCGREGKLWQPRPTVKGFIKGFKKWRIW